MLKFLLSNKKNFFLVVLNHSTNIIVIELIKTQTFKSILEFNWVYYG